ncbi:AT-hook motif nuclear-localized 17-like [Olea europaea subsp. europaea]|uniref:AT-hook motif nuclear-localized 17-like n=2 Tax=Olea europaea subsp. europaea TaxID=158383 RepID=A0A8S0RMW9_OLEEU|nr:AT-hook motif nuclear-localized 17-like [Olea europaea subsp. europaea]
MDNWRRNLNGPTMLVPGKAPCPGHMGPGQWHPLQHPNQPVSHRHHHQPRMANEEADSQSHSTPFTTKTYNSTSADGGSIDVVRRPRGRPPGSKNKPKTPVIITQDSEPSMSPYVLEISDNTDIVEAVTRFCRKRNMGLCVLHGNGVVANVSLKQPSSTPGAVVTFHGHFNILSISATVLPGNIPAMDDGFKISLAGPQGQVVGGLVVGPLLSAGTNYLIASTFNSPSFQSLPLEHDHRHSGEERQKELSGLGDGGPTQPGAADSSRIPSYSYQSSEVIWAPAARQPPPPPY